MEGYTLSQIFLTFLIYAFLGWILEVGFHLFKSKKFINRGFLDGPLCPIYGVGAVLILGFLGHLKNDLVSIFIGGALFASLLELVTGYTLKRIFKTRWWDYSHKKFNIGGYVSLDFTLIWGFVSIFMMKVLQPRVGRIVARIPESLVNPVALFFLLIFLVDLYKTISSLVSFRTILRELNTMRIEREEKIAEKKLMREKAWKERGEKLKEVKEWEELSEAYEKSRLEKLQILNSKLELRHRVFIKKYPEIISDEIREKLKSLKEK